MTLNDRDKPELVLCFLFDRGYKWRPRRRWEDNIRMELEEIGISAGNWVDSAQDRNYWRALVNAEIGRASCRERV